MKKIAALFLFIGILSCTDVEKAPEPDRLYPKEKMAAILTDLYIVEGAIASNRTAYLKSGILPSSYIYDKYETDSITFKENLDFYTDRVEDYLGIMEQIQENLKSLQDSVNVRQERINKKQQTSIPKHSIKDSVKGLKKGIKKE